MEEQNFLHVRLVGCINPENRPVLLGIGNQDSRRKNTGDFFGRPGGSRNPERHPNLFTEPQTDMTGVLKRGNSIAHRQEEEYIKIGGAIIFEKRK